MGAVTMQDWHAEAVRLRDEGQVGAGHREGTRLRAVHDPCGPVGAPGAQRQRRRRGAPRSRSADHRRRRGPGDRGGPGRRDGPTRPDRLRRQGPADRDADADGREGRPDGGHRLPQGRAGVLRRRGAGVRVTGRDTLDKTTMIPTTAVQHHAAKVFELHVGDEEQILVGLFRQLVRADRQGAAAIADVFVREANGGS
jgi:hypothetical protein